MSLFKSKMRSDLLKSGLWTTILTVLYLVLSWNKNSVFEIFSALGFFILLYFLFFSIGREEVSKWMRSFIQNKIEKAVLFPTFLIALYYSYPLCICNKIKTKLFIALKRRIFN